MIIQPDELSKKDLYKLLIGSVVPRPIAWVSTVNKEGKNNLAPFSFYNVACTKPAILAISIGPSNAEVRGTEVKDTLANIRETGDFVINVVTLPFANEMHESSLPYPPGEDEFAKAGLTPVQAHLVKSPLLKESPINMECTVEQIIPLGQDHLVLGRLVCYHVQDDLYHEGRIDTKQLNVVGRLAGNYAKVNDFFELPQKHNNA